MKRERHRATHSSGCWTSVARCGHLRAEGSRVSSQSFVRVVCAMLSEMRLKMAPPNDCPWSCVFLFWYPVMGLEWKPGLRFRGEEAESLRKLDRAWSV